MAATLDYAPTLGGVPYDPEPAGGGVDLLRLFAEPSRTGAPVVEVGPAPRATHDGDAEPRFRFTFSQPADGVYYATVSWRENATAPPFVDRDEVVVFPMVARQPWDAVTGADLAVVLGNAVPRAHLDAAARVVSGHLEGYTRGRSVGATVPRDVAAVALAAALRLCGNLRQHTSAAVEGQSVAGAWRGWTIAEQQVLNRYRRRSA